jgi:D-alanyl-D-alanine carboxypeptidase
VKNHSFRGLQQPIGSPVAFVSTFRILALLAALAAFTFANSALARQTPEASLLIEADTGKVLHAENATMPWYPASLTKLMTAYVTLQAVRNGRLTLDTLLQVSARAHAQQPSKMGFKPGTQITVDNALKMLMVKSANDVAVVLAEGVSGSIEKFADDMNRVSRNLGMTQSTWVNPNGLPAENQISSARDLAILARGLLHDFPEYDMYWHIPAIRFGKRVMRNYNTLIGRYDGADGMKTGFICASGFNLVASASRHGKRLIAVVLGSPSSPYRGAKAAGLLERGFNRGALAWLAPSLGSVEGLQPINVAPPDLRDEMCGPHRKRPAAEEADDEASGTDVPLGFMLSSLPPGSTRASSLLSAPPPIANPVVVYAGPGKKPAESQFASVRAKLAKAGRIVRNNPPAEALKRDPHTAPLPLPAPAPTTVASTAALPPAQTVAAAQPPASGPVARPGAFAPPPNRFERSARALPGATDVGNPSWMSFAPTAARASEVVSTLPAAAAEAKSDTQLAGVPMPRPRPKIAAKRKRR